MNSSPLFVPKSRLRQKFRSRLLPLTLLTLAASGSLQAQTATTAPVPARPLPVPSDQAPKAATPAAPSAKTASTAKPNGSAAKSGSTDSTQLSTVVVTESDLTSTDIAAHDLNAISGATSLVLGTKIQQNSISSLSSALSFQPGVLSQSNNGEDQARLSIRGSGIQRGATMVPQGIQLLISGQSIKTSSGYPIVAVLEPLALDYIEIYRGQSAFADWGPQAIGGAINFVTKTGYDASPFQVRSEIGSDYFKEQISSGEVVGPFDYYASVTRDDYSGFRDGSVGFATRGIVNLGYQITPDLSTRLNVEYSKQYQQNPGQLTWAQLQQNPNQSQTPAYTPERKDVEGIQIASNTVLNIDNDSSVSWGALFEKDPDVNPGTPASETIFKQYALNGSIHYKRSDTLFGDLQSNTKVSYLSNNVLPSQEQFLNAARVTVGTSQFAGSDNVLVLSNDLEVIPNFWVNPGVAGMAVHRGVEVDSLAPGQTSINKDYYDFVPDLGLRYEFTPQSQVYFNAGRTVEAPYGSSYVRTGGASSSPTGLLNLDKQISDTVEIGTRGESGIFRWDLALYNSWIEHELLTTYVSPTVTATTNANKTIHQGIEAGLDTVLWQESDSSRKSLTGDSLWEPDPKHPPTRLVFQQSYTFNHFNFDDDPHLNDNQIAGVPVHLYQAELRFEHSSGFHIGPTLEASLTRSAADYANTIWAPAYAIFGVKAGYSPPGKHWEVFFEADNLQDVRYAAIVSPVTNANGTDSAVYTPGQGRNFSGGLSYSF
jgi:iron complex outermembrane recepter protein